MLDDILTSVAGPVSNFIVAGGATFVLLATELISPAGRQVISQLAAGQLLETQSMMLPFSLLFYELLEINVTLAIFNLIPVPPLDGSHVLRHFLPEPVRRVYDMMGIVGLLVLVYFGGGFLNQLLAPVLNLFDLVLRK
jgi:Zn-dependent protease